MLNLTMIREMLIRTTVRSQLIPIRATFIKNKQTNKTAIITIVELWIIWNSCALLVGM